MNLQRILIRVPNWIGDAVMATPVLASARNIFPESKIFILANSSVSPIFYNNPNYDELIIFKKKGFLSNLKLGISLRKYRIDLAIILPNSFSSALIIWLAGAKERIGYNTDYRKIFLTKAPSHPGRSKHRVETYLDLLKSYGKLKSIHKMEIFLSPDELKFKDNFFKKCKFKRPVIAINPIAVAPSRRWMPERFASLADKLIEKKKVTILFFGNANERDKIEKIVKMMRNQAWNFAGKLNLREFISVLSCCDMFITNDSGPMHIASALGVRIVALEGAADVRETGPYNSKDAILISKNLSCSPCVKNFCRYNLECMTAITVDDVYKKIDNILT